MERKFDLNERLINFAADCIKIAEALPISFGGNHISGQLIRSATSPALNYGEAQGAESSTDFIHKMKVCLKELRETFNCLKLILKLEWNSNMKLTSLIQECNELISIFFSSIKTAQVNRKSIK
jgi:four helix bundle protein